MNSRRRAISSSISAVAEGWLGADDVDVDDEVATELEPFKEPVTAVDDDTGVNDVDSLIVALAEPTAVGDDGNEALVEATYC